MTKIDYQEYLIESLKKPEEAADYLNAALSENDIKVFLLALSHVVKTQGGVNKLANKAHKSRTSLYKTLSPKGNPYFKNTSEILSALWFKKYQYNKIIY